MRSEAWWSVVVGRGDGVARVVESASGPGRQWGIMRGAALQGTMCSFEGAKDLAGGLGDEHRACKENRKEGEVESSLIVECVQETREWSEEKQPDGRADVMCVVAN